MIMAEMTSPEIDALPRDIVVLIPVASCEQHSYHLPVFTDSMIGGEVARRVHERCPDEPPPGPGSFLERCPRRACAGGGM